MKIKPSQNIKLNCLLLVLGCFLFLCPELMAGISISRVALVIGNQDYPTAPLENTLNDSRLVKDVLTEAGFKVIYQENADFETMNRAADAFGRVLNEKSIGIFYFAGHGVQVNRVNYLMPIKSKIEGPSDLKSRAINLQLFLGKMNDAQNIANVAIIDACRDNPFTRGYRGGNGALVDVPVPGGTLVAYATAEGQLANDSSSDDHRHSPYTKALAKYMREPGLAIESVFTKVAKAVYLATHKHQDPHISGNLRETFVLKPLVQQRDREFWDMVKDSRDPRDFQSYLKEYHDGIYTGLAKVKIRQMSTSAKKATDPLVLPLNPNGEIKRNFTDPTTGMEFIFVPGGCYMMGSNDGDNNIKPAHRVCVDDFYIGKYEVTQRQWLHLMDHNPSRFKGNTLPVENVNWAMIRWYFATLFFHSGLPYTLPTEAEWEYAARSGGTNRKYSNTNNVTFGWFEENSGGKTRSVGLKQPNGLGLFDMIGNVNEIVDDLWHVNYAGAPTDGRGWNESESFRSTRVIRGGSWRGSSSEDYVTCRGRWSGNFPIGDSGLRLVLRVSLLSEIRR